MLPERSRDANLADFEGSVDAYKFAFQCKRARYPFTRWYEASESEATEGVQKFFWTGGIQVFDKMAAYPWKSLKRVGAKRQVHLFQHLHQASEYMWAILSGEVNRPKRGSWRYRLVHLPGYIRIDYLDAEHESITEQRPPVPEQQHVPLREPKEEKKAAPSESPEFAALRRMNLYMEEQAKFNREEANAELLRASED